MTTNEKTICLARLIGLEHKTVDARVVATRAVAWTDGSVEWRWYPWRPYECEADLEPIKAWLKIHHPKWPRTTGCDGEREHCEAFCDAVLAAFDPTPEPTERTEHNDAMPPDLPELSEKERRAMESVDMTPILGTPAERLRLAVDTAIRFMRERDVAQTSARMAWGEHNSVVDENERLREQLADITNATTAAMGERCDCGERHCTCVPLLREEVKRLTAELAAIREAEQERKAFAAHVFDMLGKSTNPHPRPPVVLEDSDGF